VNLEGILHSKYLAGDISQARYITLREMLQEAETATTSGKMDELRSLIMLIPPRSARNLAGRCLQIGSPRCFHKLSEDQRLSISQMPDLEGLWNLVPPANIIRYFERLHRLVRVLLFATICCLIWYVTLHSHVLGYLGVASLLLGASLYSLSLHDRKVAEQSMLTLNSAWLSS